MYEINRDTKIEELSPHAGNSAFDLGFGDFIVFNG